MMKKTTTQSSKKKGPRALLPGDSCPRCGAQMKETRGTIEQTVNGEKMKVRAVPHRACLACGEILLGWDESGRVLESAMRAYRAKHDLLSPEEIQALREELGLTQQALGRLLRLGRNTIWRWETGRVVQTASMDVLLRMLRDMPENLEYLKHRAA